MFHTFRGLFTCVHSHQLMKRTNSNNSQSQIEKSRHECCQSCQPRGNVDRPRSHGDPHGSGGKCIGWWCHWTSAAKALIHLPRPSAVNLMAVILIKNSNWLQMTPIQRSELALPGSPKTRKCFPPPSFWASAMRPKLGKMFLSGEKPTEWTRWELDTKSSPSCPNIPEHLFKMLVTIPDCRRNLKITQHDFELQTMSYVQSKNDTFHLSPPHRKPAHTGLCRSTLGSTPQAVFPELHGNVPGNKDFAPKRIIWYTVIFLPFKTKKNKIKHSKKVTKSKLEERFVVGPCGVKGEVVVVILAVMIGCRLQSLDISI